MENAVQALHNLIIPDPNHAIAEGRQIAIALPIRGAVGVLATVDLDNQPPLTTSKVGVVRPDWFLPDEFESIELPVAKL